MNEMKELLLEILEKAIQQPDINATQQMGVQLSSTIKKEGVVIIQNQNVEVLTHIVPTIIKALRLCDEKPQNIIGEILEISHQEIKAKTPVLDYCRYLYELNTNWEDLQTFTKDAYMEYVLSKFKTKSEAARFLDVGPTYLSKLLKEE